MNDKPTLILGSGTGWSATTPLWYSLQVTNQFGHCGLEKEDRLLKQLSEIDGYAYWKTHRQYKLDELLSYRKEPRRNRSWGKHSKYLQETEEQIRDYFRSDPNIDTYVKYYKILWENVKHDYKAVMDFSNDLASLPLHFLVGILPVLKQHFNVKVLIIYRDPVRRHYSEMSAHYRLKSQNKSEVGSDWKNRDIKDRFKWRMIKSKHPDSISYWKSVLDSAYSYVDIYKKWSSLFPTLPIVMEELWGGKTKELSEFLDYPINDLYDNCYYPEQGTKAPRHELLKDQWISDMQDLSEEDISYGREKLAWIYDEWYNEFHTRPWG